MKTLTMILCALFTLTGAVSNVQAEEKLGRLFFTPERRALLERQRQLNIQEQQTVQGATMSLDGIVVRSSGKKTVWINGRPQQDNSTSLGVETRIAPNNPGKAGVVTGSERQTDLRVGQTINRGTQEITDGLGGGRLEVKPPAGKP